MHLDARRIRDTGNAIILHARTQDVAGQWIGLARLIERITYALDHGARRLAVRERGRCDFSDRKAGVHREHADMAEPGIDLDLDHLHGTWHAGADHDVGEPAQHEAEDR